MRREEEDGEEGGEEGKAAKTSLALEKPVASSSSSLSRSLVIIVIEPKRSTAPFIFPNGEAEGRFALFGRRTCRGKKGHGKVPNYSYVNKLGMVFGLSKAELKMWKIFMSKPSRQFLPVARKNIFCCCCCRLLSLTESNSVHFFSTTCVCTRISGGRKEEVGKKMTNQYWKRGWGNHFPARECAITTYYLFPLIPKKNTTNDSKLGERGGRERGTRRLISSSLQSFSFVVSTTTTPLPPPPPYPAAQAGRKFIHHPQKESEIAWKGGGREGGGGKGGGGGGGKNINASPAAS